MANAAASCTCDPLWSLETIWRRHAVVHRHALAIQAKDKGVAMSLAMLAMLSTSCADALKCMRELSEKADQCPAFKSCTLEGDLAELERVVCEAGDLAAELDLFDNAVEEVGTDEVKPPLRLI